MIKILSGDFEVKEYYNCDNNKKYNLLIYNYMVNNTNGYNIVIGEVKKQKDIEKLINLFNKIIKSKIDLSHPTFICSYIKELEEYKDKESINYSQDGYNLLFSKKFMQHPTNNGPEETTTSSINQIFYNSLKSVIIDRASKRFIAIDNDVFHPIEYYENKELGTDAMSATDKPKQYAKVINS